MKQKKDDRLQKLSYESDGKMGENNNRQDNNKAEKIFFNSTQDSE